MWWKYLQEGIRAGQIPNQSFLPFPWRRSCSTTVERGHRAERSILVLTETLLGMMPQEGREVVKIKETASIMKTSIKRVYTICNVLEGIRLMVRTDRNTYEWQGRRVMMPSMMLLRQMAEKQNIMEKLDMASTEEQGVKDEGCFKQFA